jgi:hypothetical protein
VPVGARRDWPLIGRAVELERIAGARAAGMPGVVLLAGAGVGKSRLARAAMAAAEQGRAGTVWVQATRSAASVPLGAFASVIPAEVRSDDLFELLRGGARAIGELAGTRPLVVGVDDAQLLDPVSAALVLHLTSATDAFVLATVRTGEPCPDAVVSLWKDAGAQRLELTQLGEEQTAELVESIVGGPLEEGAQRWIWETSRGNALYIRELVLGALGSGALHEVSGLWRMPRRPPLSASLADAVSARLAGLTSEERQVLELLALGEPLAVSELIELVSGEPADAVEARGLITAGGPGGDGLVRLAHPLYGEAIRASLPSLRARELRLALAAMIEGRGDVGAEGALLIARWRIDAGAPIATPTLVAAARAATLSGDADLGAELARRALDAGAGPDAALLLARSDQARKRFAEAESVLAGIEGQLESPEAALAYLEQRVPVLYWGLKRPEEAQALLARAVSWWPEASWRRRLDPMRLHLASMLEGPAGVVAVTSEALADPSLDERLRSELQPLHAVNLFYSGRTVDAYELIRRLRPAVPITSHSAEIALISTAMIPLESGLDWEGMQRDMAELLEAGVRAGDDSAAGVGAVGLGGVAFLAGRYRDASRWLAEAELHFEHRDIFGVLLIVWATQSGVARLLGDYERMVRAVKRCEEMLHGEEPLPNQIPYLARARAWTADAQGDQRAAQRILLDGAESMVRMPVYDAQLRYDSMRCGTAARVVAESLQAICERCDAPLVAAYAGHAAARAGRDGTALLEAAETFAAIGTLPEPQYLPDARARRRVDHVASGVARPSARADGRVGDSRRVGGQVLVGLDRELERVERRWHLLAVVGVGLEHVVEQIL